MPFLCLQFRSRRDRNTTAVKVLLYCIDRDRCFQTLRIYALRFAGYIKHSTGGLQSWRVHFLSKWNSTGDICRVWPSSTISKTLPQSRPLVRRKVAGKRDKMKNKRTVAKRPELLTHPDAKSYKCKGVAARLCLHKAVHVFSLVVPPHHHFSRILVKYASVCADTLFHCWCFS